MTEASVVKDLPSDQPYWVLFVNGTYTTEGYGRGDYCTNAYVRVLHFAKENEMLDYIKSHRDLTYKAAKVQPLEIVTEVKVVTKPVMRGPADGL